MTAPALPRSLVSALAGLFLPALALVTAPLPAAPAGSKELVHVDAEGVIRWNTDNRELALYGANYCLPSSSDYRAAGYVGADREKLVEKDLAHFARMGWDAMRISFWGDWESCDLQGNLIADDHVDVMDYAIAEAGKRGVHVLLSPITTYSAWWPDAKPDTPYPGFSKVYQRSELGTNLAAIAAQCNYLKQILNHVNPYTGVALKDDPTILFVEMINEPAHHPEDFKGSVDYIDALVAAVRSTGCQKLLFHNLTQDRRIAPALRASKIQGLTAGWYPTGLNAGHLLTGNYLRTVDDYPPLRDETLRGLAKIVYEFDIPDTNTAVMYPAMARTFRSVGVQFATMFSYDMLDTAAYNLGWQTHFLNLVYSPKKAMGAVIAAEVMRSLPRGGSYGAYPANTRFGPARVNPAADASELVTDTVYLSDNGSTTPPPDAAKLRRVAGFGSSPVVGYEGLGAYFLDQLGAGLWRLELYPDAVLVQDPFAQYLNAKTVSSRLVWHEWPMTVRLPDLGEEFTVTALDDGNTRRARAAAGTFPAYPGVYLLSRAAAADLSTLPARIGHLGLREFICPPGPKLPPQILPAVPETYAVGQPVCVAAEVVTPEQPSEVTFHWRAPWGREYSAVRLARTHAYRYEAVLPAGTLPDSGIDYYFTATTDDGRVRRPAPPAEILTARAARPADPLVLFDAAADVHSLAFTRIGDGGRSGVFKFMPAAGDDPAAVRIMLPLSHDRTLDDYTTSLTVKPRLTDRQAHLPELTSLHLRARGPANPPEVFLTLVESDGTSWSGRIATSAGPWSDVVIPLSNLTLSRGVKLPLGFPERWNYWLTPAAGRGGPGDHIRLENVERVQLSLRPAAAPAAAPADTAATPDSWIDLATVSLQRD
jgi:hypothetical protein